jgi:hypothetical protein
MNKKFSELSTEEMKKVWNNNEVLRREVEYYVYETEMEYIIEKFNPIRNGLINISVGFYNRNIIEIDEDRINELYNGIEKSQSDYCLFNENDFKIIQKCFEDEDYNRVEDMLLDVLNSLTNPYCDGDLYDYFYEFYSETFIVDTYFVDEDYTLYKNEVKSFN